MRHALIITLIAYGMLFASIFIAEHNGSLVIFNDRTPFDVATLTLAAAAVALTGVGVIVAVAAIWGYKEIKDSSIRAAKKVARETAERVARDTAQVVAARTIVEAPPLESTEQEAEAVIDSLENDDDEQHG